MTYLVLDEADRMLDRGFENDIRAIISHTKQGADRQTMMCEAFFFTFSWYAHHLSELLNSQRHMARIRSASST